MFDRNILLFISHELSMKHGRIVTASCPYPSYVCMYACMPAPMCLALCTVMCVLCISVHYNHNYLLCMLSLLPLHIHHASLQGPGVIVTHLQWWLKVWRSYVGFCTDISWCVKCSKSHCLGFLTTVKTVLFPVLLDLKVSRVWRPQRFPKDQTHPDSELEL